MLRWLKKKTGSTNQFLILLVLLPFLSCLSSKRSNQLTERGREVVFVAHYNSFDSLTKGVTLRWWSSFGLSSQEVDLKREGSTVVQIQQPSLFYNLEDYYIYPGETINVDIDSIRNLSFSVKNNVSRTKELAFFNQLKTEINIQHLWPNVASIPVSDTISLNIAFSRYRNGIRRLFDSLTNSPHMSANFKRIAEARVSAMPFFMLMAYYRSNREALIKNRLYIQRIKESILPGINRIANIDSLFYGFGFTTIEQVANILLPQALHQISSSSAVNLCIDSASAYFTGISRDFVVSKIIYNALHKNVHLPDSLFAKYNHLCKTEEYKSVINGYRSMVFKYKKKTEKKKEDLLLDYNNRLTSLSKVLGSHKGKVIILDFWSSWCGPCIREMPGLKTLADQYNDKNVVFLSISLDKEFQNWKNAVLSNSLDQKNGYILVDSENTNIIKTNAIDYIPRYMIVNRSGKIINNDAPRPSNVSLKELINKVLADTTK